MASVRAHASTSFSRLAAASWVVVVLCACAPGVSLDPTDREIGEADRARFVQRRLEDARAYEAQGRATEAESSLREALAAEPDHAGVLRALARRLEADGRDRDGAPLRARADAIDPPLTLPDGPAEWSANGLLVILQPPVEDGHPALGPAGEWPDRAVPQSVAGRLRIRLPHAAVTETSPTSVAAARSWLRQRAPRAVLSLALERASCGRSLKDGPFAVAAFRVAVASNDGTVLPPASLRETDDDPASGARCGERAIARLIERILGDGLARSVLTSGTPGAVGAWDAAAARSLFPGIGARVERELERGRSLLAAGRTADADAAFRRALAVDPDDADALALREESRATLALAREIGGNDPANTSTAESMTHDAPLGAAARNALETRFADERIERDRWLSTVRATLDADAGLDPALVASLTRSDAPAVPSAGQRLARAHAEGDVELRSRLDGEGVATVRVWVDRARGEGILREEARATTRAADTWTVYRAGRRQERFEDRDGDGIPETHLVFDASGALTRIEQFRTGAESAPLRVIYFEGGAAVRDERDTNADGRIDRIDHLGTDGSVVLREDDSDGDGRVDIRTRLRAGRIEAREVIEPASVASQSAR